MDHPQKLTLNVDTSTSTGIDKHQIVCQPIIAKKLAYPGSADINNYP